LWQQDEQQQGHYSATHHLTPDQFLLSPLYVDALHYPGRQPLQPYTTAKEQPHSNTRLQLPETNSHQQQHDQHRYPQQQQQQQQQQQKQMLSPSDALAPEGGLPLSVSASLNQRVLFMAALSDFAYVKDFGSSHMRLPCGPCLRAWGAQGEPVVIDSRDEAGGVSHCTVVRTGYDLFLLFR
jgi:hypothetical protein